MQIRTKLTLQFIIVVLLIIVVSFGIIYWSADQYRKSEFFQRLEFKSNTNMEMYLHYKKIDPTLLILFDRSQKDKLPKENIRIFDERNVEVYHSLDTALVPISPAMIRAVRAEDRLELHRNSFEILGMVYREDGRTYVVFASAVDVYGISKLNNLRITLLVLLLIVVSVVAFAGWLFAGRALSPLSTVIDEVDSIDVDKLEQRLQQAENNDEIGRLIETFNNMLARIEESVKIQRLFLSGASHELRNPLASITSQLQVLIMSDRSTEEYKTNIKSVIDDIRRLNRTTLDLIEYARLNHKDEVPFSKVRIDDALWQTRDQFQLSNPHARVLLRFNNMPEDPSELIIIGNDALLRVAFMNLIDNACKFSRDATCYVSFSNSTTHLTLEFMDNGKGMSTEEVAYIFEPFYRANNTAEIKGHGLGLALTKKIISLHAAKIQVISVPEKGTTFKLSFRK